MSSTLADFGEHALVAFIAKTFEISRFAEVGIGDDCAVIESPSKRHVVTADTMIESVHFLRHSMSADQIGQKLVAVNVSDIAAMGATPLYGILSVCLPPDLSVDWVKELISSIAFGAGEYGFSIAGGDVTASPGPIVLNLTLNGTLVDSLPILRSGAQPDDQIYVTGTLGTAALGLELLLADENVDRARESVLKHCVPKARLESAKSLACWKQCHAMMDISDGLSMDTLRMAEASEVSFVIDVDALPLHSEVARLPESERLSLALHGGEDYELLFTASSTPPISATKIGRVKQGFGSVQWIRNGQPFELPEKYSFQHFKR